MHPLMTRLHNDHRRFQRLFQCLKQEILSLRGGSQRPVDLAVLLDAIDYIQTYPEKWHHPVEDQICQCLLQKKISQHRQVAAILAEHEQLEQLTEQLSQQIYSVASDCTLPITELIDIAEEFVLQQSAHIDSENLLLYPLIEKYLTDTDWCAIETGVAASVDPLFDTPQQERYETLYQHLVTAVRTTPEAIGTQIL